MYVVYHQEMDYFAMQHPIIDLALVKQLAEQYYDNFEVMRYMLEVDDVVDDDLLDAYIDELAAPIIAAIDCKQCANCCRSLDVELTTSDLENVASAVHVPVQEIVTRYVGSDDAGGPIFRTRPCPFLNGNLCGIYAHRPEACRIYPAFTPDFRWTLADTIDGASYCPISFNVLMNLLERLDEIFSL